MSVERASTGFEVEFSLSIAAVPAWAPIGIDADDYRVHLFGTDAAAPLPETLLHHQERWGHISDYDDFADLLPLDRFDADALGTMAADAGADTIIVTATSADGWSWWDTADERCVARRGPRRDVVAELAAATRARGLSAGIRLGATNTTSEQLHTLRERYEIEVVSGRWSEDADPALVEALEGVRVDLDRPGPPGTGWRCRHEGRPAADAIHGPWLWHVPTGSGFGINRADPASRRLRAAELIMRYVDTSSRGGSLRLVVPLAADGSIDDHDAGLLHDVGPWIRRFASTVTVPPTTTHERRSDGTIVLSDGEHTYAVIEHDCRLVPRLAAERARVVAVLESDAVGADAEVAFRQDDTGLHLPSTSTISRSRSPLPDDGLPRLLRLEVATTEPPAQLFPDVERGDVALAPLLEGRAPGEIVHLGDGPYAGPATVPAGVTLRGLGDVRTRVTAELALGRGARLEHLCADDVTIAEGADDTMILGCTVGVAVLRGDRSTIRASRAAAVEVVDGDGTMLSRCRIGAARVRPTAISITGGRDHEIDACTITDVATAIDITDAEGATVRGCTIRDVGTGVRLTSAERAHVCASRIVGATRSIDVVGGLATLVDGNVVIDADSGVVVRDGATGVVVSGNYWERCRTGALLWDVADVKVADNAIESLGEPEQDIRRGPG